MDSADFALLIDQISFYLDITILVILLIFELIVFYKLKFKIDRSGILTLLLHILISSIRVYNSSTLESYDSERALISFSSMMVWCSLHYFTFEIWKIKTSLVSESFQIKVREEKKVTSKKRIDLVLMLILTVLITLNNQYENQFYRNNAKILSVLFFVQQTVLSLINLVILSLFIYLFKFLLEYRESMTS